MALIFPRLSLARLVSPKSGPAISYSRFGLRRTTLLSLGIILAIALAACGRVAAPTNFTDPAAAAVTGDPVTPSSSTQNPNDFAFTLYQGQERLGAESLNFSDLQGTPVILNFWAGLCGPCRAELPEFQKFYNEYQDRVVLLGIDVGQFTLLGNQDDARSLLQAAEVTYPSGFTEDPMIMRNFNVFGIPTTVFVDSEGGIFQKYDGVLTLKTLSEITDEMLGQEKG